MVALFRLSLLRLWQYRLTVLLVLAWLGLTALMGMLAGSYLRAQLYYRAAQRALEKRDFAGAQAHLAIGLQAWRADAPTHFLAARTARRSGSYDEAERHLKECERLGGSPEALELERKLLRAQRGDWVPVEAELRSLVQQNHADAVIILEALTRGARSSGHLPRTQAYLQLWLERQPDDVQALLWHGEIRKHQRHNEEALDDFRRVLEREPQRDDARLNLAQILYRLGRIQEAMGHYECLRQRQPARPEVIVGLARCHHDLYELGEAQQLLDSLLAEQPKQVSALMERGRLALRMGKTAQAENWLSQAVKLAPEQREAYFVLHLCLEAEGKTSEDQKCLAQLRQIETDAAREGRLRRASQADLAPQDGPE